jgi:hypothetical protein
MFSNARGMAICIGVTGVASILLWFYFKNRIESVETKLDSMFNMIQNFSTEQAPTIAREEVEYYQEEPDPFENKDLEYVNQMASEQLPQENKVLTNEMVNQELIKVSDNEGSGSEEEESGSEEEESGSEEEESGSEGEEPVKKGKVLEVTNEINADKTLVLDLDTVKTINLSNDDEDSLDDVDSEESEEEEDVKNVELKDEVKDYAAMKVSELKKFCSEKGLTGYTKLNKAGLVNLLENN